MRGSDKKTSTGPIASIGRLYAGVRIPEVSEGRGAGESDGSPVGR